MLNKGVVAFQNETLFCSVDIKIRVLSLDMATNETHGKGLGDEKVKVVPFRYQFAAGAVAGISEVC